MANLLGMDIKKLRNLEMGLRKELNYVLGLLEEDTRKIMLRILKDGYDLVWADQAA